MTTDVEVRDIPPFKLHGLIRYWGLVVAARNFGEFVRAVLLFMSVLHATGTTLEAIYNDHLQDPTDPHNGDKVFEFLRRFMD